jgi:hypothetical protein
MSDSKWDLASLVDGTLMSFDPGDKKNGSLYICDPANGDAAGALIAAFRAAGLWSDAPPKQVGEDQKEAYKGGLKFVEAVETAGGKLVLLRCDHPKFPSDAGRWEEWKRVATYQK